MVVRLGELAILSDQITTQTLPVSLTPDLREHFKKLKQAYAYSAQLLLVYHAIILVALATFSIWHCYRLRSRRWRRKRHVTDRTGKKIDNTNGGSWVTRLLGRTDISRNVESGTPTADNEETPLVFTPGKQSQSPTIWIKWRSFLMYEPEPLPLFNRAMPSNATSALVVLILGLNVFFLVFSIEFGNIDTASIVGDRAAWLFVANLPWLYILGAKHQPIQLLTGYSYENLNILHRRLGEWLCLLAVVHGLGMVASWYNFLRLLGLTFPQFLAIRYILYGLLALIGYELLFLTSLARFRAWWYEMFLGCHIFLQAAALVLLFLHHHCSRFYVGIALMVFLLDRLVLRWRAKTGSFQADLTVLEDGETVLVSADWPLVLRPRRQWTSWRDHGVRRGWNPSQHVFVTIPALGQKHLIQAHPFTIASAAPGEHATHAWLNLIIRAQAGFSRDLLRHARNHDSALVRLDGPYGSTHALQTLRDSELRIIVAGGSGIAVAYPLLWSLLMDPGEDFDMTAQGQVHLIWIVQDASHLSWLGGERLDELREKGLHVILPPPTRKCGRPDMRKLLRGLVEDETRIGAQQPAVSVLVSGPNQLNRTVRNICAEMVGEGQSIEVVVEKYGW